MPNPNGSNAMHPEKRGGLPPVATPSCSASQLASRGHGSVSKESQGLGFVFVDRTNSSSISTLAMGLRKTCWCFFCRPPAKMDRTKKLKKLKHVPRTVKPQQLRKSPIKESCPKPPQSLGKGFLLLSAGGKLGPPVERLESSSLL